MTKLCLRWTAFALATILSAPLAFGGGGPTLEATLVDGPDADVDLAIDVAVEVGLGTPTTYEFELDYSDPTMTPGVSVTDLFIGNWDVQAITGATTGLPLGCGGSADFSPDGNVHLQRGGNPDQPQCNSATHLTWTPPAAGGTISVRTSTRFHNGAYRPSACGKLTIGSGAVAATTNPVAVIATAAPVCLVGLNDLNGGGIVPDGTGDEDGDTLEDYAEACIIGTNPCLTDSDGDGYDDGDDIDPVNFTIFQDGFESGDTSAWSTTAS